MALLAVFQQISSQPPLQLVRRFQPPTCPCSESSVDVDPRGRPLQAHHRGWPGPWTALRSSPGFSMAYTECCLRNPPVSLRVLSIESHVYLLPTVPASVTCPPSGPRCPQGWCVCHHHRNHKVTPAIHPARTHSTPSRTQTQRSIPQANTALHPARKHSARSASGRGKHNPCIGVRWKVSSGQIIILFSGF